MVFLALRVLRYASSSFFRAHSVLGFVPFWHTNIFYITLNRMKPVLIHVSLVQRSIPRTLYHYKRLLGKPNSGAAGRRLG